MSSPACWNILRPHTCQIPCSNCLVCGTTIGPTTLMCLLLRTIDLLSSRHSSAAPVTKPFLTPLNTRSTSKRSTQVKLGCHRQGVRTDEWQWYGDATSWVLSPNPASSAGGWHAMAIPLVLPQHLKDATLVQYQELE